MMRISHDREFHTIQFSTFHFVNNQKFQLFLFKVFYQASMTFQHFKNSLMEVAERIDSLDIPST